MLTEIAKNEIPSSYRSGTRNYAIQTLQEFLSSGMVAARVDIPGKSAKQLYAALRRVQVQYEYPLNVVRRSGKVYLIREEGK